MTIAAPFTPRRSTRGAIFTPSLTPSATPSLKQANTTYTWTSAPLPSSSSSINGTSIDEVGRVRYNSYSRIISRVGSTPLKMGGPSSKRIKAGKGDEESRFTVGDGVLVSVEGGDEGVGILIGLWEEPSLPNDDDDDNDNGEDGLDGEEEEDGPKMMAEIHWAFRKVDLPGVMKNVNVEENEVLLAASLTSRPVTSILPLPYLLRTIPIYSKAFYRDQFPETKSKVKGWSYIRQGVYWCHRAFDKFAKGGKNWRVDIDLWREGGKKTGIWDVPVLDQRMKDDTDEEDDEESGDDEGSEVGGETVEEESDEEGEDEEEEDEDEEEGFIPGKRKRSRPGVLKPRKKQKKTKRKIMNLPRRKTKPHPKSLTKNNLPSSIESLENLPVDPYERALRLLHVGSTPESLPCREEEFLDVLGKVEDGVESGGGGCLYIAGVPGTGKTATVHAVVKELKRKAEDGELQPFSYVEINGLKIPSPQHAYTVLWEAISGSKGSSTKTALRGLENHFGRKGGQGVRGPRGHTFVVLMDELDQLLTAKQDVVYNFFNWPTMRDSQLFVIAVANRMDLPQHLAAKIKSRIGLQTILFQPYDRAALISIVQSRLIPHPLAPSGDPKVLLPDAIALAATKMAGTNGDARRVLDACRRAVEVALEGGLPSKDNTKTVNGSIAKQNGPSTTAPKQINAEGPTPHPHPVTAKEMMSVLQAMSQSPVSKFIGGCSIQQKLMLCSLVRCIRREGIHEISWRNLKGDFDNLSRSFNIFENTSSIALNTEGGLGVEDNILLSNSELNIILSSLLSSHALICGVEVYKSIEERKVALGMEIGETGRVLMNEGESWRRALAGV